MIGPWEFRVELDKVVTAAERNEDTVACVKTLNDMFRDLYDTSEKRAKVLRIIAGAADLL